MYYQQGYPYILRPLYEQLISEESVFHAQLKERLPVKNKGYFIHCMVHIYIYQVADDKEKLRFRRTLKQFPFLINQNLPLSNSNEQPQNFVSKFCLSSLIR